MTCFKIFIPRARVLEIKGAIFAPFRDCCDDSLHIILFRVRQLHSKTCQTTTCHINTRIVSREGMEKSRDQRKSTVRHVVGRVWDNDLSMKTLNIFEDWDNDRNIANKLLSLFPFVCVKKLWYGFRLIERDNERN